MRRIYIDIQRSKHINDGGPASMVGALAWWSHGKNAEIVWCILGAGLGSAVHWGDAHSNVHSFTGMKSILSGCHLWCKFVPYLMDLHSYMLLGKNGVACCHSCCW